MLNTDESLAQKFIQKWSWIFLFTILTAPLGYIIRIILTNDISIDEIWVLYWIISLLILLGVYNDFGLTESLNYFLPKYIIKKDYARCKYLLFLAFSTQLITSIVLGIGLFIFADFIAEWHFESSIPSTTIAEVIKIMWLYFLGLNMMQVTSIIFSASQNTKFQKWADFLRMFLTTIGISWLFFLDQWDLITYAWAWIIGIYTTSIIMSILWYIYYYKPYFQWVTIKKDLELRKTLIRYSLWTFVWSNIWTLLHNLDQQILQNMTNTTEWWIYAIYLSLIGIPFIFISPILGFLFPVISEIHSRWQHEKIQTIQSIFSNSLSIIMIWVSWFFVVLWTQLALFLYGNNYYSSWLALFYIAPFLVLNILIQINFQIMAGTGMVRERVWILWKTLIINIILVIWLIYWFKNGVLPFPNAASATSFWVWVSWIMMWLLSHRATKKYQWAIDWYWLIKNCIIVLWIIFIYFQIYWFQWNTEMMLLKGRLWHLMEILFVFFISLGIFLLVNKKRIQEFLHIIKEVRHNKNISHSNT